MNRKYSFQRNITKKRIRVKNNGGKRRSIILREETEEEKLKREVKSMVEKMDVEKLKALKTLILS